MACLGEPPTPEDTWFDKHPVVCNLFKWLAAILIVAAAGAAVIGASMFFHWLYVEHVRWFASAVVAAVIVGLAGFVKILLFGS